MGPLVSSAVQACHALYECILAVLVTLQCNKSRQMIKPAPLHHVANSTTLSTVFISNVIMQQHKTSLKICWSFYVICRCFCCETQFIIFHHPGNSERGPVNQIFPFNVICCVLFFPFSLPRRILWANNIIYMVIKIPNSFFMEKKEQQLFFWNNSTRSKEVFLIAKTKLPSFLCAYNTKFFLLTRGT